MHRYQPKIYVVPVTDDEWSRVTRREDCVKNLLSRSSTRQRAFEVCFSETQFITVTAYQNQQVITNKPKTITN